MEEIYEEDEDINPYFDDIALGSSTIEEHCRLLRRKLLEARKANLKFNVLKTQLSQTSVYYLGHVLSDEGIKPVPKKIRAIEEFAIPNCKEDVQKFLGMTDHKPILGLSKKPFDTISPGLQRMLLRLNKYNIQLEYVPGKNLVIADALSRAQSTTDNLDEVLGQEATVIINLLTQASPTNIQPAKDMPSPAELLMGRKLRTFLPSHPGQLKPTFVVERVREVLRKRQIIQNKCANKHATVLPVLHQNAKVWFKQKMKEPWKQGTIIQVGPQPRSCIIKGEDGGVFRRNRFHIRQDYTENDNPWWSRTVEDLCNIDSTEISRIPNDSADSQINASPKTNTSNINQRLQVPNETYGEQNNPVVQKSSRNIVKPFRYRDN
ncbi:integrase catalytic domain-containing protein [Trichonephila inaurata madagascariensis]|uniref:Integrase catalytic domain-containing protein n=1 Tax=Trichonephila inaurata madagascariensis TaxID=2747483 RepID=A0A8X6JYC3_9ARAC|nr:integrase catalytic domain-containing protein [Trichonephila inaurata madagascariensis]